MRFLYALALSFAILFHADAGNLFTCNPSATPAVIRSEGVTEPIGQILLICGGGTAGAQVTMSASVTVNATVTNRVSSAGLVDAVISVETSTGFQALASVTTLTGNTVTFQNVNVALTNSGTAQIAISNIRVDGSRAGANISATVFLQGVAQESTASLSVGTVKPSWLASFTTPLKGSATATPFPDNRGLVSSFFAAASPVATTRVSEIMPGGFVPAGTGRNIGADTGDRFVCTYSGLPPGAGIYVPQLIAGYDSSEPTAAGQFGFGPSSGTYLRTASGSLLLAMVQGADQNGAGGTPVTTGASLGTGFALLDTAVSLPVVSRTARVVYEVVDVNPAIASSAEIPVFLVLAANMVSAPFTSVVSVTRGPVSLSAEASAIAPIPRFVASTPATDCSVFGSCAEILTGYAASAALGSLVAEQNGSPVSVAMSVITHDPPASWSTAVAYAQGQSSGWLSLSPASGYGSNNAITVTADPSHLSAGTYFATVSVLGGRPNGSSTLAATLTVSSPTGPVPQISAVTSAADFSLTTVTAGSLATIFGTNLGGEQVSLALSDEPATILFADDTQINFQVPPALAGQSSASAVVSVNQQTSSAPFPVTLASFAPGIFAGGVLNQNGSRNSAVNPAAPSSYLQVYATGISDPTAVTLQLGVQKGIVPAYSGPAPGFIGLQQINVQVPSGLGSGPTTLSLCSLQDASAPCSTPFTIYLAP
jgi:uncharacterized protein (TIGR03437 family)